MKEAYPSHNLVKRLVHQCVLLFNLNAIQSQKPNRIKTANKRACRHLLQSCLHIRIDSPKVTVVGQRTGGCTESAPRNPLPCLSCTTVKTLAKTGFDERRSGAPEAVSRAERDADEGMGLPKPPFSSKSHSGGGGGGDAGS